MLAQAALRALLRKSFHHVDEAAADLPEDVLVRHEDVLEEQLGGVRLVLADLLQLATAHEAGHVALDGEQRDPSAGRASIRARGDDHQVRRQAVRDERLGSAQDPAAVMPCGARPQGGEVGSRPGLGHRDGRDATAVTEAGQPALALVMGRQLASGRERRCRCVSRSTTRRPFPRPPAPPEDGVEAEVAGPGSAVLLRYAEPEEAAGACGCPDVAGNPAMLADVRLARSDLALDERGDRLSEPRVLIGEDRAIALNKRLLIHPRIW